MTSAPRRDPMERLIEQALTEAGMQFVGEDDPANLAKLDFYLPTLDVYIEVKRMHTTRIADQTARADNVIVAQGERAVDTLASLLRKSRRIDGRRSSRPPTG